MTVHDDQVYLAHIAEYAAQERQEAYRRLADA